MSLQLTADSAGGTDNAAFLSIACDLAYMPQADGAKAYRELLGLDGTLVSVDNTQAYVCSNDDNLVVAFRGSEKPTSIDGLKDWFLTNAMNLLILPEGRMGTDFAAAGVGARFHQGFLSALTEVWDPLFAAVEAEQQKKERPLWVTGHSLGGALALMGSWLFKRKFVDVHQVYTFGAPMIGNEQGIAAFNKALSGKVFRFINRLDPIPCLPTVSLLANQYLHCDKEMAIGEEPPEEADKPKKAVSFFKLFAAKSVDGLLGTKLSCGTWDGIKDRIGAHGSVTYRELSGGK